MKKLILIISSLLLITASLHAQRTIYIVNNVTIEHFDGSALKGKYIQDYKVTTTGTGRDAITVHSITTFPTGSFDYRHILDTLNRDALKLRIIADSLAIQVQKLPKYNITYMIDGKEYKNSSAFQALSPEDIKSISIDKKGNNHQIVVTTKKGEEGLSKLLDSVPGLKVAPDGSMTINGEAVKRIVINGKSYSVK